MQPSNPDYEDMLRRENETLKRETQLMRDQVSQLSPQPNANQDALGEECRRLRGEVQEKERELLR